MLYDQTRVIFSDDAVLADWAWRMKSTSGREHLPMTEACQFDESDAISDFERDVLHRDMVNSR